MKFQILNPLTLCATVVLILFALSLLYIHLPDRISGIQQTDFPNYYFAGKRLWEGRVVYAPLTPEVMSETGIFHDAPIADTPFLVTAVSVLSFIPYHNASLLLLCFSSLLFVITISIFCDEVKFSKDLRYVSLAVGISSNAFLFLLIKNHIEVIVFLLSVLGFISFRRNKVFWTGFYWGIAAALKLFPLFWIFCCFKHLGTRASLFGFSIFILLTIIGGTILGFQDAFLFATEVVPGARAYIGAVGNYSLISFGTALYSITLGWILTILGGVIIIYQIFNSKLTFENCWIASLCGSLILSPLSWLNYLILIIPVIPFLIIYAASSQSNSRIIIFIACISLWHFPEIINTREHFSTIILSFTPLYSLVFLFFLSTQNRLLIDK